MTAPEGAPAAVTASDAGETTGLAGPTGSPRLRAAQTAAVFRLELRRLLLGRGVLLGAALGVLPVLLMAGWFVYNRFVETHPIAEATAVYATMYFSFFVPLVIFFGCVAAFTQLVRREMRDRTLHYWLLAPIRRDLLLAGKFAAGVAATFIVFAVSAVVSYALAFAPYVGREGGALSRYFLSGPGLGHLAAYVGTTLLACAGYGAVFLLFAMLFRNAILPALAFYGWEWASFLMPPALKRLTVVHWLHGLTPVPVSDGPFALLAEAPPAWLAVPGLVAFAAVLVAFSIWRFRRMEVLYSDD